MLTSDLDSDEEKDKGALDALLTAIIKELDLTGKVCHFCQFSKYTTDHHMRKKVKYALVFAFEANDTCILS